MRYRYLVNPVITKIKTCECDHEFIRDEFVHVFVQEGDHQPQIVNFTPLVVEGAGISSSSSSPTSASAFCAESLYKLVEASELTRRDETTRAPQIRLETGSEAPIPEVGGEREDGEQEVEEEIEEEEDASGGMGREETGQFQICGVLRRGERRRDEENRY